MPQLSPQIRQRFPGDSSALEWPRASCKALSAPSSSGPVGTEGFCSLTLPVNPHFPRSTSQAGIRSQIFTLPPCQVQVLHEIFSSTKKFVASFPSFCPEGKQVPLSIRGRIWCPLLSPGVSLQIYLFISVHSGLLSQIFPAPHMLKTTAMLPEGRKSLLELLGNFSSQGELFRAPIFLKPGVPVIFEGKNQTTWISYHKNCCFLRCGHCQALTRIGTQPPGTLGKGQFSTT